ncbi:hypothetical protein J4414_03440 [Candidatus Woesearchaeota archaeon]|nr:hypothetical protein [Candidatus Woesearchaeota archaeon]
MKNIQREIIKELKIRSKQLGKISGEYLKIAFYCEESKHKKSKNTEAIQFNLNKSDELLKDGLNFMESLKDLLKMFDIETTKIWLCGENIRKKDGKVTRLIRFRVKANSVNRFINEIGWMK